MGLGRYPEAETLLNKSYAILAKNGGAPRSFQTLTQTYLQTLHRRERGGDPHTAVASTHAVKNGQRRDRDPPGRRVELT